MKVSKNGFNKNKYLPMFMLFTLMLSLVQPLISATVYADKKTPVGTVSVSIESDKKDAILEEIGISIENDDGLNVASEKTDVHGVALFEEVPTGSYVVMDDTNNNNKEKVVVEENKVVKVSFIHQFKSSESQTTGSDIIDSPEETPKEEVGETTDETTDETTEEKTEEVIEEVTEEKTEEVTDETTDETASDNKDNSFPTVDSVGTIPYQPRKEIVVVKTTGNQKITIDENPFDVFPADVIRYEQEGYADFNRGLIGRKFDLADDVDYVMLPNGAKISGVGNTRYEVIYPDIFGTPPELTPEQIEPKDKFDSFYYYFDDSGTYDFYAVTKNRTIEKLTVVINKPPKYDPTFKVTYENNDVTKPVIHLINNDESFIHQSYFSYTPRLPSRITEKELADGYKIHELKDFETKWNYPRFMFGARHKDDIDAGQYDVDFYNANYAMHHFKSPDNKTTGYVIHEYGQGIDKYSQQDFVVDIQNKTVGIKEIKIANREPIIYSETSKDVLTFNLKGTELSGDYNTEVDVVVTDGNNETWSGKLRTHNDRHTLPEIVGLERNELGYWYMMAEIGKYGLPSGNEVGLAVTGIGNTRSMDEVYEMGQVFTLYGEGYVPTYAYDDNANISKRNIYLGAPTVDIVAEIEWEGRLQESEVIVDLYKDGVITDKSVVLSDENNWTHMFEGLEYETEKDSGEYHEYSVKQRLDGYETTVAFEDLSIMGSDRFKYTMSNFKDEPEIELVDISVEKVWVGKKLDSVVVDLLADGAVIDTKTLSDENDWLVYFDSLPAVDEENYTDIEYTISERHVDGYRSTIVGNTSDGYVITNEEIRIPELPDTGGLGSLIIVTITTSLYYVGGKKED